MTTGAGVFIAVDQGGHATRAVAYDAAGQPLASAFANVDTDRDALGRVEHDGESLVAGVRAALEELAMLVPATRWQAAGLAVQRSTVACWDRLTGRTLGPVISWQDRRQAAWLEQLAPAAERVHEVTGLPLSPHYGASKLRWCLDHVPEVREAAADGRLCAGPLASLLLARLLQRPCLSDEANASRTQLWSPHDRRWSAELLGLFGVPETILPRLVPTISDFGTLRVGGASIPLRVCTGDQAAVPFASGRIDPAAVYVNLGTGAFALRPTLRALRAPPLLTSVLSSDAASVQYAIEGTVNGAGSALDWFELQEGLPASRLLSALDSRLPESGGIPLFLNGVSGVGSPFWAAAFESRYEGEADVLGRFHAVVESIAFLLRANIDEMTKHVAPPERVVASGGLARSDCLLQTLASLTGLPVQRLADAEATARGLANLVAGQPGEWLTTAPDCFAALEDPPLQARFARWLGLMTNALGR